MAESMISVEKIKDIWYSQVHDARNWDTNKKVLRAVGLFAGSILFMQNFGDIMAI